jgi:polysaccharide pyruvyl transferase WcaK-like protein
MSAKRIGLFGNFGGGNLGNEGSLEAMLLFLRQAYPDAELACICSEPDVVRAQFDLPTLPIFAQRRPGSGALSKLRNRLADHVGAFRNVGNFDALLIPGTGFLDDFGERPIGIPYMILVICLAAKLRGVKVAFVSTGAGPIVHPLSRWFMKTAARMAAYRSYRDQISKDFMTDIGIDTSKDPVYPDLAFRLPDPELIETPKEDALTVGLGLMTYEGWSSIPDEDIYATYISKISSIAVWLLNQGHRLRLLIGEPSDQRAISDLIETVSKELGQIPESRLLVETPNSLNDLMRQISTVDAIIATRFHNVLCSLKIGKPTISIGYAKKNDVLMEAMGLGEFCQHIEYLDIELLKRQFEELIERRSDWQNLVKSNSANLQRELRHQEKFLMDHII